MRRPSGPWTPAVHELLRHLEAVGFRESPRVLGIDDRGREVLSFVEGETVGADHPWPAWAWSDALVVDAAVVLRRYHDAVAGFVPGSQVWRSDAPSLPSMARAGGQVVCHNDVAPYNVVWRAGAVAGFIDWDFAGPAPPAWDLAFAAWSFVPLHEPGHARALGAPTDAARRLRLLVDAYGLDDRRGFVELVAARIASSADGIEARAAAGEAAFVRLLAERHVEPMRRACAHLERAGERLQAAID